MRPNPLTQLDQLSDAQRLELLVDTLSDYAICMLDAEGRVASWNKGAQRLEGYAGGEILGQHFSRFFTVEDQAKGLPGQLLLEARRAGRCESEGWRVRKDGSRFWASATLNTIRAENGRLLGFARVTRDITERRAAQEALRESEDRFRLLVDGLVDYAIYMLDPSGVITNWNAGAERMKGYTADEILGQHFSRFYTKEDRAAGLPIRVLEAAAREGRYEAEGWRVRKDGSRFWASVVIDAIRDEGGELLGFAKITRDITERRAAQEALRESEHRFRVLVEGVTDYALFMLDPNGIVSNWNSGAARIKGYTAEEIVGHHFSRFYTDHERAAGMPARALQIAAQEGRYESEGWRVRKDGTLFWANAIIDAIKDRAGNLIGFAKITRDITERRQAQLALQEAQAQRDHAQKMEVLAQLTGGVAHDFNNLLMIVVGNLHRLKRLVAQDARGTRAAEAIETAVKRGESLTRQLLSFSRRQTLNPVVTEIGERIDAIRIMLASSIGESAKLVTHILPGTWPIRVDINEFELALVNLALNARDAMPQGGVITITSDNAQLAAKDTPARLEGEFVALTIADTGVGIAPDILPKVFDPFFTTKQGSKGSGLGLSQVYGFAHQSGGTVTVASELGRGTRVTLYLPRALAEPERQGAPAPEPAAAASGTVLLVEDNPDVAEASVSVLEELGYRVEVADSADAAFKAVEGREFDLVVSDIVMAGATDGIGFAREMRQRSPLLPVLLVTGYSNESIGAGLEFTVLRKPYQATELSRAIAKAIAETRPASSNLVRLSDVRQAGPRKPERSS
jgi:PAS domain S-box-containing protein